MARLRWKEDYGPYKKGDEFNVSGDGLDYLAGSAPLEVVSQENKVEDATIYEGDPEKETATAKAKTEKR